VSGDMHYCHDSANSVYGNAVDTQRGLVVERNQTLKGIFREPMCYRTKSIDHDKSYIIGHLIVVCHENFQSQ
jgi:hypothetical protein